MPLERHHDIRGRPVTVLGNDEVGFTGAGGLAFVGVLAVEEDYYVGILLQGIM